MLLLAVSLQPATALPSRWSRMTQPVQGNESMLPPDAWKTAPSASSWDVPAEYLQTLKRPALLLIDAQEDFRNYYGSASIAEMERLVAAFRGRCLPIVFKLWPVPPETEELRTKDTCVPILPLPEAAPSTESEANRTVKYVEYDHLWKNPHLDDLLTEWNVDHVIIAGGFTEHCVIATANALWSRRIPAIIPASAVGPHNATGPYPHHPTQTPSVQHEAALIAMQSSVAQVVSNSSVILDHLAAQGIAGSICANTTVSKPAATYMKHAFPKEQDEWCNTTLHPMVNDSGIDPGLGAWPLWGPIEAYHYIA